MPTPRTVINAPRSQIVVTAAGLSDVGSVRAVNEDSYLADAPIFVVADGMGGHSRGDLASATVVRHMVERIVPGTVTTPERVFGALQAAHRSILSWSSRVGIAGTTVAGVALVTVSPGSDHHWMIFNVGDSRVYGWDGDILNQLTVDHSAVQELIDSGAIQAFEAASHPERNVVTRAVGVGTGPDPDVWLVPASGRQRFLICSDGLTRELSDAQIAEALAEAGPAEAAAVLVRRAVAAGGRDNVTALLVDADTTAHPRGDAGYHEDNALGFLENTLPRL